MATKLQGEHWTEEEVLQKMSDTLITATGAMLQLA